MSSHSPTVKPLAQQRLTEVVAGYVHSLIELQNGTSSLLEEGVVPRPMKRYPSFDHFCAEQEPTVSIDRYAERLVTYMHCSPEVFIYALAYLRRLLYRGCPIHFRCVHRLLLCAVIVAAKTRDDHYWSMGYYAQVGGVTMQDLNGMELRFLADMIDFQAEVTPAEYREVMRSITSTVEQMNHSSASDLSDVASSPCDVSRSSTPTDDATGFSSSSTACLPSPPAWTVECEVFW